MGPENRPSLAAGLTYTVTQLRKYRNYFNDRGLARVVEQKYGFRCQNPRLIVIVGRDPTGYSAEEIRCAMTATPDVEIITYDRLLEAAQSLLLL